MPPAQSEHRCTWPFLYGYGLQETLILRWLFQLTFVVAQLFVRDKQDVQTTSRTKTYCDDESVPKKTVVAGTDGRVIAKEMYFNSTRVVQEGSLSR